MRGDEVQCSYAIVFSASGWSGWEKQRTQHARNGTRSVTSSLTTRFTGRSESNSETCFLPLLLLVLLSNIMFHSVGVCSGGWDRYVNGMFGEMISTSDGKN